MSKVCNLKNEIRVLYFEKMVIFVKMNNNLVPRKLIRIKERKTVVKETKIGNINNVSR